MQYHAREGAPKSGHTIPITCGIFAIANVSNSLLTTNIRKKEFSSVVTIFLENFALFYWPCCKICPGYGAIISK